MTWNPWNNSWNSLSKSNIKAGKDEPWGEFMNKVQTEATTKSQNQIRALTHMLSK